MYILYLKFQNIIILITVNLCHYCTKVHWIGYNEGIPRGNHVINWISKKSIHIFPGKEKATMYKLVWLMMYNATFNNIFVILWWSVLLVDETRIPGENHRLVASHRQTLSHNVAWSTPCHEWVRTHNFIGDRH